MTDLVPAPAFSFDAAWPSTPRAFADTSLCPRCFAVLPSSRCQSCGLELAVPRTAELIAVSNALVETERHRRELIEFMWNEQLAAQVPAAAHADAVADIPRAAPQQAPSVAPDAAVAAAASVTPPPFPAAGRVPAASDTAGVASRRSGVQVFLLVAGIVLLSVFALFFLTVAYLFATVEVRVIVTSLAGLVVLGVAGVLRHRRLPATAEGVGIAGAAILLGTLEFVRAAMLFGSAAIAPAVFSGIGLLVVAALLAAMHRITALRFALLGGLLLAPIGVALLVIGALDPVDAGLAWCAGLEAAAVSALLVRVGAERASEAALLQSIAVASVSAATLPAALLLPDLPGSSALAYSTLALICGVFLLRLRGETGPRAWSRIASILLGLTVSLAPTVAILRAATIECNLWAPGAAASVVAGAVVVLARRSSNVTIRCTMSWAQIPALVVAAVSLLPGVGFALAHVVSSLVPRYGLWQAEPGDVFSVVPDMGVWAAVLAPGIAAILGVAAIQLGRLSSPARSIVGGLAGLALLAAASHAGSVRLVLLGYLLVAVLSLSVLLVIRARHVAAVQASAGVVLGVAVLAVVVLSHASSQFWLAGVLAAAGLIVAARFAVAGHNPVRPVIRAVLSATASALLLAEATLVVPWLSGWRTGPSFAGVLFPNPIDAAALPAAAAVLVLCVPPIVLRRRTGRTVLAAADLRAVAIVALPVAAIGAATVFASAAASPADRVARIAIPLLLAVAGVLWQVRASVAHLVERVVLASLVPLTVAAALASTADAIPASSDVVHEFASGPFPAILSAAAGVLVFGRAASGPRGAARIAWESSTALIVFVAVARVVINADDSTWMILLLLAVAPLIVAFSDGNPFTGTAPRRHLLTPSCILAVAALWQFLFIRGISDIEPYTLPVGGLLLCIAAASAFFGRRSASAVAGRSGFFAAGLATALVPSALAATTESSVRAFVLLSIATVLASAALVAPRVVRGVLVRDSTVILALVVLVGVGLSRTVRDAVENDVIVPELWVIPSALALAATSIVWTNRRAHPLRVAQLGIPAAIAFTGLAALVCLITLPETHAPVRLVVASVLLAGVAVAASVHRLVPLDHVSQYTALSVLVVIAVTGLLTNAARPSELATAPLALALMASGVMVLLRDRAARSWPNLGPGILVLLAPPLLADFGGTDLWRVIALGVLAVAVVVGAVLFRLQAPLVVGGVVLITHALAQSWPWVQGLYSAVPWWIWLGVGGVVLIAVAARYEHRVRNLRSFVGSIAALR